MKRYLAFVGSKDNLDGGMNDYFGDFDDIKEAKESINGYELNEEFIDWAHIYDTKEDKIVWNID